MGNNLEVWKPLPIEGLENCYAISNLGRVRSLERWVYPKGYAELMEGRIMKPDVCGAGYEFYRFSYNGKRVEEYTHRLVAMAFIPNPDNLPEINHKDRNPLNNKFSNLEWCTHSYNTRYMKGEIKRYPNRPIEQLTVDGKSVAKFKNAIEIQEKLGYHPNSIRSCCHHRQATAHGYIWRYVLEE